MPKRQARGIYLASQHRVTAKHTLAQLAKRLPAGVICPLTALRSHGLTTQSPVEVWIARPAKARRPQLDSPRLSVARVSGAALTAGLETHRVQGVDVAVEAHRDFSRRHRGGTRATLPARCLSARLDL